MDPGTLSRLRASRPRVSNAVSVVPPARNTTPTPGPPLPARGPRRLNSSDMRRGPRIRSTHVGSCGAPPSGVGRPGPGPRATRCTDRRWSAPTPAASGLAREPALPAAALSAGPGAAVVGGGGRHRGGVRADLPECRAAARPAAAMGPDTRCRSGPARPCRLPRQRSRRSECGHRPVEPIPRYGLLVTTESSSGGSRVGHMSTRSSPGWAATLDF